MDTILLDSALRLFADHVTPAAHEAAEGGAVPASLWQAIEEAGYPEALAQGPAGMAEAATILYAAGYHAAPVPLAETMLARWLLTASGLAPPTGALTVAPVELDESLTITGTSVEGGASQIPWGRAAAIVFVGEDRLFVACARVKDGVNLAGEPRDDFVALLPGRRTASLPDGVDAASLRSLGALARAAQMAGAMAGALDLATRYANDRTQFGRPIGKFQAIQQQMALFAEEVAASSVAVECAARAVAEGRSSAAWAVPAAKIRAGEAAGRVAEIAHQVHGAIGFTQEHALHRLTRRLWSWRDEFGHEGIWAQELGRGIIGAGAAQLWPMMTAR
jgi:alkylation response protein AidB-like acyl-CoA dehydrogenase